MGLSKKLTDSQKGAIIAAKKLGHNDAAIAKAIPSHNSSTVLCSPRIKKISAKTIRSAAHSQSAGSTKIKNRCYCEQKITTTKSEKNY